MKIILILSVTLLLITPCSAGQWINANDQTILKNVHSEFSASAKDTSYSARVAALNDTLAQFAKEIVNHID